MEIHFGLWDPCLAQCPTWQHYEPYEMPANHPTIEPSGARRGILFGGKMFKTRHFVQPPNKISLDFELKK